MKPNKMSFIPAEEKNSSVMSLLKSETAAVHRQLERNRFLFRLFQTDFSIQEYRQLLCKFYGFFSAIEPLIFTNLNAVANQALAHRTKSELIVMDLSLLEMDETNFKTISKCEELPLLNSFARQMGALYVLEGSTLGGRIISKRLKDQFGETIVNKMNYYQSYGENLILEWTSFQNFMAEHFDDKEDEISEVVNAAIETFLCLDSWLEKP
jgi:heme oxygenase (biliverdin-IX-beta and delta-forming)